MNASSSHSCTCLSHKSIVERLDRVEKDLEKQQEKDESMATKLNLILGGIFISPFIVALLTLLIKTK